MWRMDIIKHLIKTKNYKSYLEVGVSTGITFKEVVCDKKVGVDPGDEYPDITFKMKSDAFFRANKDKFDLIFIDGHHEEKQVIRDIENSVRILNPGGTIVCHDMNPVTEQCQQDPMIGSGTCWKGWVRLRSWHSDLLMRVVNTDYGCGIITRGTQEKLNLTQSLTYENLRQNRQKWLNLITEEEFLKLYA